MSPPIATTFGDCARPGGNGHERWATSGAAGFRRRRFASWVSGFVDGATGLIQCLRARDHVGCPSNTNAIHWARLPGVSALFDSCFPPHVTGFMKPERGACDHALGELRVRPRDGCFLDDLIANVAAAREVGSNAFCVRGLESPLDPAASTTYAMQWTCRGSCH